MHPIEFIEKNIRTYLLNEGFSQSVAQGGGKRGDRFLPPIIAAVG
ncbi:TPA: hypothetical protein ACNOH0_000912 [Enterobacter hormaechei]